MLKLMEFRYLTGLQDVIEKIFKSKIKIKNMAFFQLTKILMSLMFFNNLFIINEQINSDPNKAIESHIKIILKKHKYFKFH